MKRPVYSESSPICTMQKGRCYDGHQLCTLLRKRLRNNSKRSEARSSNVRQCTRPILTFIDWRFSALRIDGVRAYELARAGKEFPRELALRTVKVADLEMIEWIEENSFPPPKEEASQDAQDLEQSVLGATNEIKRQEDESGLDVEAAGEDKKEGEASGEQEEDLKKPGPACRLRMTVSGGFYVRSLCYDLGVKMNSGAYMADLVRTRQGDFTFEDAVPWEDFTEGGPWEDKVVSVLTNPPKPFKEPEEFKKSGEGTKS